MVVYTITRRSPNLLATCYQSQREPASQHCCRSSSKVKMKIVEPWQVVVAARPTALSMDPDLKTEVPRTPGWYLTVAVLNKTEYNQPSWLPAQGSPVSSNSNPWTKEHRTLIDEDQHYPSTSYQIMQANQTSWLPMVSTKHGRQGRRMWISFSGWAIYQQPQSGRHGS